MFTYLVGIKYDTAELNVTADNFIYSECAPIYVFLYACTLYFRDYSEFQVEFFLQPQDRVPELRRFYADY